VHRVRAQPWDRAFHAGPPNQRRTAREVFTRPCSTNGKSPHHASPLDKQKGVEGSEYASEPFQILIGGNGVQGSMSRSGNVWDEAVEAAIGPGRPVTAAMNGFVSSLETERIRGKVYRRHKARADVFDDIERFCNAVRRHWTTGCISPVEFERSVGLA
jgi:putative transposase